MALNDRERKSCEGTGLTGLVDTSKRRKRRKRVELTTAVLSGRWQPLSMTRSAGKK